MLYSHATPERRRRSFREALAGGRLLRFPGAFSPIVARIIEEQGWEGVYLSGAALSADLALPDIGLLTLSEVAYRGRQIQRVTNLPTIVDIDTGYGEVSNVARTIQEMEDAGLSGCHIEDQRNPKRCGHLDHKTLVPVEEMVQRIQAAVKARRDESFLLIARTDARGVEGLDAAIDRAKRYIDAGADAIFPEALGSEGEFEHFRSAVTVPLLANMTEFGKSPLLSVDRLANLGFNIVIYPVTTFRLAMAVVEGGLEEMLREGTQSGMVGRMQTRKRLYELVDYAGYQTLDQSLYEISEVKDSGPARSPGTTPAGDET